MNLTHIRFKKFVKNKIDEYSNMNHLFISLGRHCDIKYQIDKIEEKRETQFFDWLRSDFECILKILESKDIVKDFLFKENLFVYKFDKYNYGIEFKNLKEKGLTLLFHHDIKINVTNLSKELEFFVEKYKRRYERMISLIQKNERKLLFIHRSANPISEEHKMRFYEAIKKINPNCRFSLFLLIDMDESEFKKKIKSENTLNLRNYIYKNPDICKEPSWTQSHYNWKEIFNNLLIKAFQ